jgi:hypothetical protein
MPLNKQDFDYTLKKLSLSPPLLEKITETERDTNLLLSELSTKNIKREDINNLSFLTYVKLLVFRYSYDTGFGLDEKIYVAQSVCQFFPEIKRELNFKLISSKDGPSEKKSQYFLVLSGFYYDVVSPQFFYDGYKAFIANGFRKNEKLRGLSDNVEDWLVILREIHTKKWMAAKSKKQLLLTN